MNNCYCLCTGSIACTCIYCRYHFRLSLKQAWMQRMVSTSRYCLVTDPWYSACLITPEQYNYCTAIQCMPHACRSSNPLWRYALYWLKQISFHVTRSAWLYPYVLYHQGSKNSFGASVLSVYRSAQPRAASIAHWALWQMGKSWISRDRSTTPTDPWKRNEGSR